MNGHVEIVRSLIAAGARPEASNIPGFTPLHISLSNGQWKAMKLLIVAGAKVDSRLPDGATPLHLAGERGHTDAVKELRRANANAQLITTTAWGDSRVPLEAAASHEHSGVVRELMRPGGIGSCGGASGGADRPGTWTSWSCSSTPEWSTPAARRCSAPPAWARWRQ